jgi:hypothetical protein
LRCTYRTGPHYDECGIMLTELCPAGTGQPDPFNTRDEDCSRRLITVLDHN